MPKTSSTTDLRDYALVADRIALFYAQYPNGQIHTEIVSRSSSETVVRASVYRSDEDFRPSATGLAAEREGDGEINTVACLENTETSAIGRALANLGFLASRQRPSVEEMQKAGRVRARMATTAQPAAEARAAGPGSRAVRERPLERMPEDDVLQAQADALTDCLRLLDRAVRAGMPNEPAGRIRQKLVASRSIAPSEIIRIERRLRDWISRAVARPPEPHRIHSDAMPVPQSLPEAPRGL
jgi:hypothetical protein